MERRIARLFDRPGLARASIKVYENAKYAAQRIRQRPEPYRPDLDDGLPRVPDRLIFSVSGTIEWGWFFISGQNELAAYDRGEQIVRFGAVTGANQCTAYPSNAYLEKFFSTPTGWELLNRAPSGPDWAAPRVQDYLLLRRI